MHHMELLSHFLTETCYSFGVRQPDANVPLHPVMRSALTAPYLMYEILAIAASHLSWLRPAQQKFYRDEAAGLQARGLSFFNSTQPDVHAENCVPMFMFSSLLGIHVLFDAATTADSDGNNFLDRFVGYLDIHLEVRAITNQSWQFLRQTELQPILQAAEAQPHRHEGARRECDELWTLLESIDLGQSSVKSCRDAIAHLQWVFDAERSLSEQQAGADVAFAWPILISAGYTDLLLKRRPEALIILAYYAVLLHARRGIWVVGDAGRILIELITAHLGTYWRRWLAWPNAMLTADASPAT